LSSAAKNQYADLNEDLGSPQNVNEFNSRGSGKRRSSSKKGGAYLD